MPATTKVPLGASTLNRKWYLDEVLEEAPAIEVEIVFRLQRLVGQPDPDVVLDVLPAQSPVIGAESVVADQLVPAQLLRPRAQAPDLGLGEELRGHLDLTRPKTINDGHILTSTTRDTSTGARW